ncbi:MAG: peroxidase-related enzyme [Bacteroidales bacterium]|nr:peroxidase-related enzyme [Bacteroidales bacterium]
MANIEVIQPSDADGYLKEVYDQILESRGKIAEIHKIQSLNPRSIIRHMDLYMTLMYGKSPLSREEREMIGVIVSRANNCRYCIAHHSEALNHYWKDEKKLKALVHDYTETDLPENQHLLCELADVSTRFPDSRKVQTIVRKLKKRAFSDRAVLDAALIISYFNFVNRIVLILDVDVEKDPGGYKY